ncbi:MAG: hypothetical protein D6723_09620 [Acidobacteria bacterium]|nr:MAG: hypothetical protein D6723_09620 [Acidobacteriota bacterium]
MSKQSSMLMGILLGIILVGSMLLYNESNPQVAGEPDVWVASGFEAGQAPSSAAKARRPRRLPQGFQTIDDGKGTGRILIADRPGARSATALLRETLNELAAYFDARPRVTGGFMDQQDREIQAAIEARFQGTALRGLALVRLANGKGTVGFIYDRAGTFLHSMRRLTEAFERRLPQPPARQVAWQTVPLPDGSGSMRLPRGWRITGAYQGMVDAQGPDGMAVSLGAAFQVFTPAGVQGPFGPMQYPLVAPYSDPVTAVRVLLPQFVRFQRMMGQPVVPMRWVRLIEQAPAPGMLPGGQSAFLHYEMDVGAGPEMRRYQCLSLIGTAPVSYQSWMYYISSVAAPKEVFKRNLPLLLEIWQSWKVSDRVLKQRLQNALQSMGEAHRIYRQATQNAERVMERALDDWAEVMRGSRTVEDTLTGERGQADLGWVNRIVEKMNEREGWNRYRAIPLRDL